MYCGDETGAIVIDTGSAVTKVGWAGRDMPDCCIQTAASRVISESEGSVGAAVAGTPSTKSDARNGVFYSKTPGDNSPLYIGDVAMKYRPNQDMVHIFEDGNVLDWEAMECLLQHSLASLGASASDHPLLLLEHALIPAAQREKMAELLFEGLNCPAAFLAKQSACAAMSAGLPNALVVDMGAAHVRVCPVTEGYQLNRPVQQSPLGMRALAEYACRMAERETQVPLRPRYACSAARSRGMDPQAGAVSIPGYVMKEAHFGVHSWTPGGGKALQEANPGLHALLQGTRPSYHAVERTALGEDIVRSVATVAKYAVPRQKFATKKAHAGASGSEQAPMDGEQASSGASASESKSSDGGEDEDEEEEEEDSEDEEEDSDDEDEDEEEEYCLPDGRILSMGTQRLELGEILFDTSIGAALPARIEPDVPLAPPTLPGAGVGGKAGSAAGGASGSSAASSSSDPAASESGAGAGAGAGLGRKRGRYAYEIAVRTRLAKVSSMTGSQGTTSPLPHALHRLVHTSLGMVDVDIRPDLCRNILLCGGGSLIPGVADRLQTELSGLIPSSHKPRVVFGTRLERQFAPWIGGSVLSSLGTFQQLWIGQKEYEEEGAGIVERRCGQRAGRCNE